MVQLSNWSIMIQTLWSTLYKSHLILVSFFRVAMENNDRSKKSICLHTTRDASFTLMLIWIWIEMMLGVQTKTQQQSKIGPCQLQGKKIPIFCLVDYAAEIHSPIMIFSKA